MQKVVKPYKFQVSDSGVITGLSVDGGVPTQHKNPQLYLNILEDLKDKGESDSKEARYVWQRFRKLEATAKEREAKKAAMIKRVQPDPMAGVPGVSKVTPADTMSNVPGTTGWGGEAGAEKGRRIGESQRKAAILDIMSNVPGTTGWGGEAGAEKRRLIGKSQRKAAIPDTMSGVSGQTPREKINQHARDYEFADSTMDQVGSSQLTQNIKKIEAAEAESKRVKKFFAGIKKGVTDWKSKQDIKAGQRREEAYRKQMRAKQEGKGNLYSKVLQGITGEVSVPPVPGYDKLSDVMATKPDEYSGGMGTPYAAQFAQANDPGIKKAKKAKKEVVSNNVDIFDPTWEQRQKAKVVDTMSGVPKGKSNFAQWLAKSKIGGRGEDIDPFTGLSTTPKAKIGNENYFPQYADAVPPPEPPSPTPVADLAQSKINPKKNLSAYDRLPNYLKRKVDEEMQIAEAIYGGGKSSRRKTKELQEEMYALEDDLRRHSGLKVMPDGAPTEWEEYYINVNKASENSAERAFKRIQDIRYELGMESLTGASWEEYYADGSPPPVNNNQPPPANNNQPPPANNNNNNQTIKKAGTEPPKKKEDTDPNLNPNVSPTGSKIPAHLPWSRDYVDPTVNFNKVEVENDGGVMTPEEEQAWEDLANELLDGNTTSTDAIYNKNTNADPNSESSTGVPMKNWGQHKRTRWYQEYRRKNKVSGQQRAALRAWARDTTGTIPVPAFIDQDKVQWGGAAGRADDEG
jgi:hypothetical protein